MLSWINDVFLSVFSEQEKHETEKSTATKYSSQLSVYQDINSRLQSTGILLIPDIFVILEALFVFYN